MVLQLASVLRQRTSILKFVHFVPFVLNHKMKMSASEFFMIFLYKDQFISEN